MARTGPPDSVTPMGVVILVRHGQASFGADDYDVLSGDRLGPGAPAGVLVHRTRHRPDRRRPGRHAPAPGDGRRDRRARERLGRAADRRRWDEFDHLAVVAAYPDLPPGDLDRRAFQRAFEQATARWTGGGNDAEYAEPWLAFRARVTAALDRAQEQAGPGGTVVVVSLGGPIAAACAALVDPEADDASFARLWSRLNTVMVNASYTRVVVGSTGPRLLTFNEHLHLEGEP